MHKNLLNASRATSGMQYRDCSLSRKPIIHIDKGLAPRDCFKSGQGRTLSAINTVIIIFILIAVLPYFFTITTCEIHTFKTSVDIILHCILFLHLYWSKWVPENVGQSLLPSSSETVFCSRLSSNESSWWSIPPIASVVKEGILGTEHSVTTVSTTKQTRKQVFANSQMTLSPHIQCIYREGNELSCSLISGSLRVSYPRYITFIIQIFESFNREVLVTMRTKSTFGWNKSTLKRFCHSRS